MRGGEAAADTRFPGSWPLVGRARELDLIGQAIGDARRSGVVLSGASGVGKTRLATEALAIATRIGFDTARALASRTKPRC